MIIIENITIQNFLAITDPLTISFNDSKITTVSGENGASKSAIFIDAIYYALYGKSFRKANIPNVINKTIGKKMLVKLNFSINSTKYTIVRGIKPNIFEIYINGVLKDQNASTKDMQSWLQNYVIKINEKTFKQLAIIGSSSYSPFMLLTALERRTIIDELLDINIYTTMNKIAKEELNLNEASCNKLLNDINNIKMKINIQKKNDENSIQRYKDEIENKLKIINELTEKNKKYEIEFTETLKNFSQDEYKSINKAIYDTQENISNLNNLKIQYDTKHNQNVKMHNFFLENSVCPMCTQKLEPIFVNNKIEEYNLKEKQYNENSLKFKTEIEKWNNNISSLKQRLNVLTSYIMQSDKIKNEINKINSNINIYKKEIENIQYNIDNYKSSASDDINKYKTELNEIIREYNEKVKYNQAYQKIIPYLKDDGIKTIVIKSNLQIINALLKKYLDIISFPIKFEFNDNFEAIIERDGEQYNYENFSEGEKLRINSCIMFTFRELTRMRSNNSINILILDEFDGGVADDSCLASISDILLNENKNTNTFIISHNIDYFTNIANRNLYVERNNENVTVIEK